MVACGFVSLCCADAVNSFAAGDEGAPHIEMDLACGVLQLQDAAAVAAAERDLLGGLHSGTAASSSGSDSSDSDVASDSDEHDSDNAPASCQGANATETASPGDQEIRAVNNSDITAQDSAETMQNVHSKRGAVKAKRRRLVEPLETDT